jgi:hypothetical protein
VTGARPTQQTVPMQCVTSLFLGHAIGVAAPIDWSPGVADAKRIATPSKFKSALVPAGSTIRRFLNKSLTAA